MKTAAEIHTFLHSIADQERAQSAARFFKTGAGEYAAGDIFIGIPVPQLRQLAQQFRDIPLEQLALLLTSAINEERLLALLVLILQFKKADAAEQERLYHFYIRHLAYINNWNLVDTSAPAIVGAYLFNTTAEVLLKLAASPSVWERRIAIVSTYYAIKKNKYTPTIKISTILLSDSHDLIHKAVGWMLREVGKKDLPTLIAFLDEHAAYMPRTMLRYAIEKLSVEERAFYLKIRAK